MNEVQPGIKIGRFIIREHVDEFGVVLRFKVFDEDENRTVELVLLDQVVKPEQIEDVNVVLSSFESLSHPHLAEMISSGYFNGRPYLVRRIIPGERLSSRLGTPIASMEAARHLAAAVGAIAYMHDKGIIHGCINPDSIVLNAARQPIIIDAGVGAILSAMGIAIQIDQDESLWCYRAPETEQGIIDYQSDIYSIGAIYYEMLGGQKPFSDFAQKSFGAESLRNKERDIPWIAEQVALKALSPKPADRFDQMGQLALALEDLSREDQFSVRTQKWQKAMWFMLGTILLILIFMVVSRIG